MELQISEFETNRTPHTSQRACYIDGLVQDCGNRSALAMELLQSWTKPSILCQNAAQQQMLRKVYFISVVLFDASIIYHLPNLISSSANILIWINTEIISGETRQNLLHHIHRIVVINKRNKQKF